MGNSNGKVGEILPWISKQAYMNHLRGNETYVMTVKFKEHFIYVRHHARALVD